MPSTPQDHKKKAAPHVATIGGVDYLLEVPNAGLLRSVRRRDAMDLMFTLFEECSPDLVRDHDGKIVEPRTSAFLSALDALDMDELNVVFSDWMATLGGGDAGKSGGSSA